MNDTPIEIHEFSTGIKPDRDAGGNWFSRGFTGRYMNCTLPKIPYNVERAIANQLFAVVEGYTTEQPAIIGRVVPGKTDSRNKSGTLKWSVVAIVSLGRDEKGRPLTVYRYFLSQGFTLHKVVDWIEKIYQDRGILPVFNPFEQAVVNAPHIANKFVPRKVKFSQEIQNGLIKQSVPIVLFQKESINEIHYRAAYKAVNEDRAISWAYNVEALEFPESFILIHTADKDACRRIKDALNDSDSSIPRMLPAATVDIQMLKASIKSLMSGSVKQNTVRTIVEALEDDLVTEDIWQKIFDGEGATRVIEQGIYSPLMLRLLTLRAVAIPRTLPDFLNWFENNHDSINKQEFLNFQYNFRARTNRSLRLEDNLFEGIVRAFESLKISTKISPKLLSYFLSEPKIFWNICFYKLLESVDNDLVEISRRRTNLEYSQFLWQGIINFYNLYSYKNKKQSVLPEYKPFAILFEHLAKYDKKSLLMSAYFYQISQGVVKDKLFREAFGNSKLEQPYLGIIIQKQLTLEEKIFSQISTISKAVINISQEFGNFIFKVIWLIINNVSIFIWKITTFFPKLMWSNGAQLVDYLGRLKVWQQLGTLISIYLVVSLLLWIHLFGIPKISKFQNFTNLIATATQQENFDKGINLINKYFKKLLPKSLSNREKLLFVLDELSLTDRLEENCITNQSPYIFSKYENTNEECRKSLAHGFKDYEKKTVEYMSEEGIKVDGIIEAENIEYIESQISDIFDFRSDRYQRVAKPIIQKTLEEVNNRINKITEENKNLDVNYWFKVALKNSITPKSENLTIPDEYLQIIDKTDKDVVENPQKYTKDLVNYLQYSSLENLGTQNADKEEQSDGWIQKVWIERILASCLKSEECTISSTTPQQQVIESFQKFMNSELLPKVEKITHNYLETIRLKNNLEKKFPNKSLETARADFGTSLTSIKDIEDSIYQKLLSNLGKEPQVNKKQEKNIKKEIQQIIKQTLSINNSEKIVYISEIDINEIKDIKLDKLDITLNIDNVDHFKSQLQWIEAIFDYQSDSNPDGIISSTQGGTGLELKNKIMENEFNSLLTKAKKITNKQ